MKSKFCKLWKGLKHMIDDRVEMIRDYLARKENRIVLGLIFLGLGMGLVISGYIPMPNIIEGEQRWEIQ